ncbi:MAG: NAD(P)H-hydrate dehydratase [Pseudomonadales bacterium]
MTANHDLLPANLFRAEQVRELDRLAIQEHGIPGYELMRRAGRMSLRILQQQWPEVEGLCVYCGGGNNGGDGFVIARLAKQQGLAVRVIMLAEGASLKGDALLAWQHAVAAGVSCIPFADAAVPHAGIIIDALLGTGLQGDVRADYAIAIEQINSSGLAVLAVDIPSGICSDTGRVWACAVNAQHTCTFIGLKQGLFSGRGPAFSGQLHFDDLQVPAEVLQAIKPSAYLLSEAWMRAQLPTRPRDAHKGHYGHVLIIGGDRGMAGAAAMAAEAAARVGAGLVSAATRPEHVSAIVARRPEIMTHGVVSGQELEPLLVAPSVIVLGPGLGQQAWGEQLFQKALSAKTPLVVDADALNLIANQRVIQNPQRDNWILTPHPGEAARLLGISTAQVQEGRFAAVKALQQRYGGVIVLKGSGTLIAGPDGRVAVAAVGNPGMASGGMGDVLSGVLGGLLAQGHDLLSAARLGVLVHGLAADRAARDGERGMLAEDVLQALREVVNP